MRRVLNSFGVFCVLAVAISAAAQSLPSKEETAQILAKADVRMKLNGPGSQPFHLVTKLQYTIDKNSLEGTYEILWAAADRYREEFRLGPMSATYVAVRDKLYILRNTPTLTYQHWRVRSLVGVTRNEPPATDERVGKVYATQRGSENVICADFEWPYRRTECFQPTTGELVSIEHPSRAGLFSSSADSFLSLGEARYPGHMLSTTGGEVMEVRVEKLEAAPRFEDDVFVAPAGATARGWCAQPEVTGEKRPQFFGGGTSNGVVDYRRRFSAIYADVAPDGYPKKFATIYPDGSTKDINTMEIPRPHFPIHRCGGRPIQYETIEVIVR